MEDDDERMQLAVAMRDMATAERQESGGYLDADRWVMIHPTTPVMADPSTPAMIMSHCFSAAIASAWAARVEETRSRVAIMIFRSSVSRRSCSMNRSCSARIRSIITE